MNKDSKEYKALIKKLRKPKFSDGDKVRCRVGTSNPEEVVTIDGEAYYNGYVWMYHIKEYIAGIGQEYFTSAYEYIAYNNLTTGAPTEWKLFVGGAEAMAYAQTMGNDWDMTYVTCFKDWYPDIDLKKKFELNQ